MTNIVIIYIKQLYPVIATTTVVTGIIVFILGMYVAIASTNSSTREAIEVATWIITTLKFSTATLVVCGTALIYEGFYSDQVKKIKRGW